MQLEVELLLIVYVQWDTNCTRYTVPDPGVTDEAATQKKKKPVIMRNSISFGSIGIQHILNVQRCMAFQFPA